MLTIQPKFGVQSFGYSQNIKRFPVDEGEYVDFEELEDSYDSSDSFDYETEKENTRKELDLWQQTKANVEDIAKTTSTVPGVKTGTKILTGLTTIAVGWGGLRWGTVGTLEVLSKIAKTDAVKSVSKQASNIGDWIVRKSGNLKNSLKQTSVYENSASTLEGWKNSFLDTRLGTALNNFANAVGENRVTKSLINAKNNTINYFKNVNYKRVAVESMGVAGGGTAAVNVLGGNAIDGRKQNVETDEDGNYYINGRMVDTTEEDYFDAD